MSARQSENNGSKNQGMRAMQLMKTRQQRNATTVVTNIGQVEPMRDFQTWLITQVTVARGAACQIISELPVCPDYTVYTSQASEQDNKTHLTWPKTSCAYWL